MPTLAPWSPRRAPELAHSLRSCSLRLQRLLWQTGWAVGINSSTFMLRSREVNSFPARAGEAGGESHPEQKEGPCLSFSPI